jgi:hypothetical protein
MKSFIAILAFTAFLTACNNDTEKPGENASDNTSTEQNKPRTECYLYTKNKDSISLQVTINDKSVSGELVYSFHEKDMNQGVIQGELRGDTLLAEYEFKSEGIVSTREVSFLKKGDGFAEGYGEAEEKEGKMVFKNAAGLTYSDTVILKKTGCTK